MCPVTWSAAWRGRTELALSATLLLLPTATWKHPKLQGRFHLFSPRKGLKQLTNNLKLGLLKL